MTRLVKWDPFKELEDLHREVFGNEFRGMSGRLSAPVADVYTEDNNLITEIHLPNFSDEEVDVNVHNGMLEIKAEHTEKSKSDDQKRDYVVRESATSFYRSFALPKHFKEEEIEANFDDGVLKVTVPLEEEPRPKKITVKKSKKSDK